MKLFLAVAVLSFAPVAARSAETPETYPRGATAREIELGKKAVEQLSKDPKFKLLDEKKAENKALVEKLNAMAQKLGKASERPDIEYKVSVVDDKDLNAFTVPNGRIYFNKGLIDLAGSDDELAAVMAHEIGHNSRMHAVRGEERTKPINWIALAATLAALTGKAGADIAAITPYILTGVVSGYSVEYEKEADGSAVPMLVACGYNPSALVTFMNRLADEEKRRPKVELGIFQTHPPSPERAAAALKEIGARGITYNPRAVAGGSQALVKAQNGGTSVMWNDIELLSLRGDSATARAESAAKRINEMMRNGLRLHEVLVNGDANTASLSARGIEIVHVDAADAKTQNLAPLALAQKWRKSFTRLFWKEAYAGTL
ncbi:MAG TPA: M48 family metalloprotease [Abditibacteriaceae bacterium]|jgi:Zn-dependent protease with chaperone function